jgi:hypothetical protein
MEAARTDGGGSGGGAGDGAEELEAENGRLRRRAEELAVLAVRANANATGSASNLAGLVGWFGNNGGAFGGGGGGVFGGGAGGAMAKTTALSSMPHAAHVAAFYQYLCNDVAMNDGWRGWRRHGLTAGAVVVVRAMVGAMARYYRPFPRSLMRRRVGGGADNAASADIRDQRRAEGEILGEDLRLDGPPMFELGGV